MMHSLTFLAGLASLVVQAQANTVIVNVGDGGLVYKSANVTAAVGDTVEFVFAAKGNHSVAQSSFSKPCHPAPNGIFSGYFPALQGPSNTSFAVTINDTNPIWYYCSQVAHCTAGMVGVINPPQNETIDSFITAAKADHITDMPGAIMGGAVIAAVNSTSTANSTSSGGSSTSSGSPSGSGTGSATGSAATPSKASGAWTMDATAASGVGCLVALFAGLLL